MNVCQVLTGHGGWPLSIFMTPDKKPFFAGTYFPKNDRMGIIGFITLLDRVSSAWQNNREDLMNSSSQIVDALRKSEDVQGDIPKDIFDKAYSTFKYSFDNKYGGFGSAPKFPTPHNLYFLLRYWYITGEEFALEMVEKTLGAMRNGGIYDHIGFGFCRYSTDKEWLVPHFEKMLYDNALLAIAYLEAYQVTKKEEYADTAKEIFTYVLRDMTSESGGLFSAEDADSEGIEGKFYVWTPDEIKKVLGDNNGELFCKTFDISYDGNFEGLNIPNLINMSVEVDKKEFFKKCRQKLFDYRENRIHPYKDDKVLTAWNGLMIAAMAIGGRVLSNTKYTNAAEKVVSFIFNNLFDEGGRLLARYRDGDAAFKAYIDDYAFLVWGLLELYQTTYKPHYLEKSINLTKEAIRLFWDEENGGFYLYGSDGEQLIIRPKEIYDGAMPSGNSVFAMNLIKLARLTGQYQFEEYAQKMFKVFSSSVSQVPSGHTFLLCSHMFFKHPTKELVISGVNEQLDSESMIDVVREGFNPFALTLYYTDIYPELLRIVPIIQDYKPIDGKTAVYICENFTCQTPVTDPDVLRQSLLQ